MGEWDKSDNSGITIINHPQLDPVFGSIWDTIN